MPEADPGKRPPLLSRWGPVLLLLAMGLLVVALGVGVVRQFSGGPTSGYSSAIGGPFTMTDQNGRTVTDESLKGRPYAIFFGFTRCPDVCPTTLSHMAAWRKQLGRDGDKFDVVFVSVDPEHDSQQGLASYLTLFDTPVTGLRGTPEQLAGIVKAYKVFYAKVPQAGGDYTIDHTASIYLMDSKGRFIGTIAYGEDQRTAVEKLQRLASS
ncbi:SCO family protein [Sandaracinobacteroides hominis]|uniref:SCO family protein n=1 Tax=Sandaracinobacteroides hominis TaxID=2780086 RepID=UPI0018F54008|nr:SCO family protein [Sandaracinobacteroides hominis]